MFCVPDELRRKTERRKHLLLGQEKSKTTLETKAEVWRHGGRTPPSTTSAFFYYHAKEMRLLAYTVVICDAIVKFLACRESVKLHSELCLACHHVLCCISIASLTATLTTTEVTVFFPLNPPNKKKMLHV